MDYAHGATTGSRIYFCANIVEFSRFLLLRPGWTGDGLAFYALWVLRLLTPCVLVGEMGAGPPQN
jgi:hypothetical protein